MADPVAEVHALEKDILNNLDGAWNSSCVKKKLKDLEEFSGKRPSKYTKEKEPDEEEDLNDDGEKEEESVDDGLEAQIRGEMLDALGQQTVSEVESQIQDAFNKAETQWRQHSYKIRQLPQIKKFDVEREKGYQRNKELKGEIKRWRKKSEHIIATAYDTQEMFEMAAQGKPIPNNMNGAGADAIWAEVFACQGNQKDKAKEALEMMNNMNAQADACAEEMKKQTEKFKENTALAESIQQGLNEAMAKLNKLSGGLCGDYVLIFLCCLCTCTVIGSILIVGGYW